MRNKIAFLLIFLISIAFAVPPYLGAIKDARPVHGQDGWEVVTPEGAGMDPDTLAQAGGYLKKTDATAFIVLSKGRIAWEQYFRGQIPKDYAFAFSTANLMLSAVTGISIARGELPPEGRLMDFYPEFFTKAGNAGLLEETYAMTTGKITLRQILANTSGLKNPEEEYFHQVHWIERMLSQKTAGEPGETFLPAPLATYLVSGAITRKTGKRTSELAHERICGPAEMNRVIWHSGPEEYDIGGQYLYMRPLDIARLGQLYLDEGQEIIPKAWVQETLACGFGLSIRNIKGYQVFTTEGEDTAPNLYMVPERGLVVVVTSYPGIFRESLSYEDVEKVLTDYLLQ